MTASLTPVWDAHAAHHAALSADWVEARRDAEVALLPFQSWRELTRTTGRPSKALDVLMPQRRPLPACATSLALDGRP